MISSKQLQILQHSTGCDKYGKRHGERNHFVTDENSDDGRDCLALVAIGLMTNDGPRGLCGGMSVFHVTRSGREAIQRQSPSPPPQPKLTRAKQRYLDFIRADSGLSFREWMGFKNERQKKCKK